MVGMSAQVYLSMGSCEEGSLVVAAVFHSAAALSLSAMEGARPRVGRGACIMGILPSERVSVSRRGGGSGQFRAGCNLCGWQGGLPS